jgi:hypothetical protein
MHALMTRLGGPDVELHVSYEASFVVAIRVARSAMDTSETAHGHAAPAQLTRVTRE